MHVSRSVSTREQNQEQRRYNAVLEKMYDEPTSRIMTHEYTQTMPGIQFVIVVVVAIVVTWSPFRIRGIGYT